MLNSVLLLAKPVAFLKAVAAQMSQMDPVSLGSRATPLGTYRTPKKSHHQGRHEQDVPPSQRFRVSYQKVTVEVDLEQQVLHGETEITVAPLDDTLKVVNLDCRAMQIESIVINERRASFSYDDFLQNEEYMNDPKNPVLSKYKYDAHFDSNSANIGINQHHMLRSRYFPLFSDQNDTEEPNKAYALCSSELSIKIPDSVKIRVQGSNSTQSPLILKSVTGGTPQTQPNDEQMYTPLNIKIKYTVKNPKNGIMFHGGKLTSIPKNQWYCYTYNNDFGCSTSSWVPCIDNLYEKPAWDIYIIVPKTLDDIGAISDDEHASEPQNITDGGSVNNNDKENSKLDEEAVNGNKLLEDSLEKGTPTDQESISHNEISKKDEEEEDQNDQGEDDDEDEQEGESRKVEIIVAVPDSVHSTVIPHETDSTKKIVNFQFFIPVCAHHLGFAVGPFEVTPMLELKSGTDELTTSAAKTGAPPASDVLDTSEPTAAAATKAPTLFYFLPGQKDNVLNSTAFMYKVFDFFSKEFSSYPFSSYSIVFLDDFPSQPCSFAGMTIASSNLLYPPTHIEPVFSTTEILTNALAEQYSGINVLPKTLNDIWCVLGISRFMAMMFLKKLFGRNFYKFTIKKRTELLCEIDVSQRPLANQAFSFPMNCDQDLDLIKLKAPLVLFMLDRRMTKTDKSFGLYRVIPKIFVQALSNDLPNGNCLSTSHFQKLCEKVAHNRLDAFFQNWINNPGVPVFKVVQKFNKKRMFIEMSISQMQRGSFTKNHLSEFERDMQLGMDNAEILHSYKFQRFVDEANWHLTEVDDSEPQHVFVGPVTVRIHESDGSPYEHVMNINHPHSKMDIQYNTKYKRKKKKDGMIDIDGEEERENTKEKEKKKKKDLLKEDEEPKINKFGDVLISSADAKNWGLVEDEVQDQLEHEMDAFEWMRFDADAEWIGDIEINLSEQMFESQLRQDRDVEAQYEAVRSFAKQTKPTAHSAKVLLRTVLDKRYYHGIRVEAIRALATMSKVENDHIGMRYLLRAFKHLFCYTSEIKVSEYDELNWKEYIPKSNQFSNFTTLYLQKAFVQAFMIIKNNDGDAPIEIKRIVLGLLKYNDNDGNDFDDCYYICDLLRAITTHVISSNIAIDNVHALAATVDSEGQSAISNVNSDMAQYVSDAIHELNRCEKMDKWTTSYKEIITKTVLEQKIRLCKEGLAKVTFFDLLSYTQPFYNDGIKLVAYEGLLLLGGLRNKKVLKYYFLAMAMEESNFLKYELNKRLVYVIGVSGLSNTAIGIDDPEFLPDMDDESNANDAIKIREAEAETSFRITNDEHHKKSIRNSITKIRETLSFGKGLQKTIWKGIHSCLYSINTKRNLFDVATVIFEARDSFQIVFDRPMNKKLVVKIEALYIPDSIRKKQNGKETHNGDKIKRLAELPDTGPAAAQPAESNGKSLIPMEVKKATDFTASENANPTVLDLTKDDKQTQSPKPTFVIKIQRESRFKIQLPKIKLRTLSTVSPKLTLKPTQLSMPPPPAPVVHHAPIAKTNNLVKIIRSGDELQVHISILPMALEKVINKRRAIRKVIKTDNKLPLRFVRINIVKKTVEVCTDDRFGGLRNALTTHRRHSQITEMPVDLTKPLVTKKVTLKIDSAKWREHLNKRGAGKGVMKSNPVKEEAEDDDNSSGNDDEADHGISKPMMAPPTVIMAPPASPTVTAHVAAAIVNPPTDEQPVTKKPMIKFKLPSRNTTTPSVPATVTPSSASPTPATASDRKLDTSDSVSVERVAVKAEPAIENNVSDPTPVIKAPKLTFKIPKRPQS